MAFTNYTRLKASLWAIPIFAIWLILIINIIFLKLENAMVKKGYWLENKVSKGILLQNQKPIPEVIFIGSSRTQNHINSQYFTNHGHIAFNYGVAGNLLWDYPHMVEMARRSGSKVVVISLPAEFLFDSPRCPQFMTWLDLNFVMINTPACLMKSPFQQFTNSLPINKTLQEFNVVKNYYPCTPTNKRMLITNKQNIIDVTKVCKDERGVLLIRGDKKRSVIIFKNGDGLIFSTPHQNLLNQVEWVDKTMVPFNSNVINYLKNLVAPLQVEGKKPIFVIEASPFKHILINKNLEKLTGIKTLYLNEKNFNFSEASDLDHLNGKGNELVTEWLYQHLFKL